jgi:hypothetical protein
MPIVIESVSHPTPSTSRGGAREGEVFTLIKPAVMKRTTGLSNLPVLCASPLHLPLPLPLPVSICNRQRFTGLIRIFNTSIVMRRLPVK